MEQAVIIHFDYTADSLDPLHDVEDQLEAALDGSEVGEVDGHEIAVDLSDGSLYLYGPDAEALFAVVRPILAGADCFHDAQVTLRFGPPEEGTPGRVERLDA